MSGSTVNCRGGLRGPDASKSTCLSVRETGSRMSAGLSSCSTTVPWDWFCPTVLVRSGSCTASCEESNGPGDSVCSWTGIAHAPFFAVLSCCSCSAGWGRTAGTADSEWTSWLSSSSWWILLSTSAFPSTWSWSNSSATSSALPFWLSSIILSMI